MPVILENIDSSGKKIFVYRGKDLISGMDYIPSERLLAFEDTDSNSVGVLVGDDFIPPKDATCMQLREYFAIGEDKDAAVAARIKGLAEWLRKTRFCCSCGAPLVPHGSEAALVCTKCGAVHYPRISPCVIAVIEKGDEILLLRHKQRNQDIFACLAGFVETGESLEEALHREVREEAGLEICNIRYAGSQAWPFPDQLMVGFYADYLSGELKIQESEILEARWFRKDDIPASPRRGSISYKLIHYEF